MGNQWRFESSRPHQFRELEPFCFLEPGDGRGISRYADHPYPRQEAWISAHVASGDFASVEEAARQLIDERIAEREASSHFKRKNRNREVLGVGDLSDSDLEAIAASEMAPRHRHLDDEL